MSFLDGVAFAVGYGRCHLQLQLWLNYHPKEERSPAPGLQWEAARDQTLTQHDVSKPWKAPKCHSK